MVFMGLSNGKFMIWDLGSNQTQEDNGHGQGRSITEVIKFEQGQQSFVITGDDQGFVQIRDGSNFQKICESQIQNYHLLPGIPPNDPSQCHMKIESILVMTLPPSNEPFLFVSSGGGYIYIIKINHSIIGLGCHNDCIEPNKGNYKPKNNDLEIGLLFKTKFDHKFCSISKNGNLR